MGWVRQPRARFRVQKEGTVREVDRRNPGKERRSGGLGRRV